MGWGGVGAATGAWLPHHCSTSRLCFQGLLAWRPLHPTSAALQGPDPRPNLPPNPCRNTSTTWTEIAQDEIYILDP